MEPNCEIESLELKHGGHESREEGMCLLESVACRLKMRHTDRPEAEPNSTVCPILASYGRGLNDMLPTKDGVIAEPWQSKLKALAPKLDNSRDAAKEEKRLRILVLASARVFAAKAMDYANLPEQAANLRAIKDDATYGEIADRAASAASAASAAWAAMAAMAADRAASAASAADRAASAASAAWAAMAAMAADRAASADIYQLAIDVFAEALNA